jgi:hypothetical protein
LVRRKGANMQTSHGLRLFRRSLLGATVLAGLQCGIARADIDDGTLDNIGQLPLPSGQFVQKQVIQVPDTYVGLVWAPDGSKFYASGGSGDKVWVYAGSTSAGWTVSASIAMGHGSFGVGPYAAFGPLLANGVGFEEQSTVAGLGLSADGSVLVAANIYNDSITVIDTSTNTKRFEYDLRPYNTSVTPGVAGGETPFTVAVKGTTTAYVSSIRDREVVVVSIAGTTPSLVTRITPGNPNTRITSSGRTGWCTRRSPRASWRMPPPAPATQSCLAAITKPDNRELGQDRRHCVVVWPPDRP